MSLAPQQQEKTVSEVRNIAVSFAGKLDSGESLSGTPTFTEVSTLDLTVSNQAISTAILTINELSVPIGEAAQCKIAGGTVANSPYQIRINCATDSTPAQTLYGTITVTVVSDNA